MTEIATTPQTREAWLNHATAILRDRIFAPAGHQVPQVRVSVGWPSRGGIGTAKRVIGQCWVSTAARDGIPQLFISPVLGGRSLASQVEVLGVLAHEMVHAADDCQSGHGGKAPKGDKPGTGFKGIAVSIGLEGKMTATVAGDALVERLEAIIEEIGEYPHTPLRANAGPPKQSTRMLKLQCPNDGYIVRTTAKWLDDLGLPECPCGQQFEQA